MPSLTQMQQDVYIASYDSAPSGGGAGTWDSPFCGWVSTGNDASNAALFDGIMSNSLKVGPGTSIRLLPGQFCTTGHSGDSGYAGWSAQSGQRIVGSGIAATTLKLLTSSGNVRYAVGANAVYDLLDGFELSDLTINCNLPLSPTAGTGAGAIHLRGSHVYLRRVRVINYGLKFSSGAPALAVITPAGYQSDNCVIDSCIAESMSSGHDHIANIFSFGQGHRFCVIRDCAVRGVDATIDPPVEIASDRVRAISPGVGIGTIIESNQVANCSMGLFCSQPTTDIAIWNNHFRNVSRGIYFENETTMPAEPTGRVIITDNRIEVATYGASLSGTDWRFGILLKSGQSSTRFNQVVVRKNLIWDVQLPSGAPNGVKGVKLQRCGEAIVENNIISHTTAQDGVSYSDSVAVKFFNNQTQEGKLLRGYDGGKFVQELEDEVQDVLLPN